MAAKRVLIVEDSNLIRIFVKRSLENYGLELIELNNAEALIDQPWRFKNFDLLLLDVGLPGVDGLTALEILHQNPEWSYVPTIMLTGIADGAAVKRAIQAGAVNYIVKPFTAEVLLERIEQAIGPLSIFPDKIAGELEIVIRGEVSRAVRGMTKLSLVEVVIPPGMKNLTSQQQLTDIQEKIKKILREIDAVFVNERMNLLLILPLTNAEGAECVAGKVREIFNECKLPAPSHTKATCPDDGEQADVLRELLTKKVANDQTSAKKQSQCMS